MGIHDREYYRDDSRGVGFFNTAPVCKWIILINVGVFVLGHFNFIPTRDLLDWFAAHSDDVFRHGRVWQLLTATFLHGDVWHLLWNMVFLWAVGREMEAMYGSKDFLSFYLGAAVFSTLVWAVFDAFAPEHGNMLGASGAVFGCVVLYTLFYPRREIMFMLVLPVEMWLLVVIYLVSNLLMLFSKEGGMTTAVESHLAGAAFGYLFKRFDLRWSRLTRFRVRRPTLRVVQADPREKPAARPSASGPTWSSNTASLSKPASSAVLPEEQLDARLDEILAKIAREGPSAITEEENRVLQEASRRAKNRRSDRI